MTSTYQQLKKKARYIFTGYTGILVQAMLICAAAWLASGYLALYAGGVGITGLLISFIADLFCQMLEAGRMGMTLTCVRSGYVRVSDVFVCFRQQPDKLMIINIIIGGIRLLLMYLGQILFQILAFAPIPRAAFIVIAVLLWCAVAAVLFMVRLSFALVYFLFFDHPEWTSMGILYKSREMMYGRKWQLFKIWFSFIGLYALSVLSFGIGLLWVTPYVDLTCAQFYEENFRQERAVS